MAISKPSSVLSLLAAVQSGEPGVAVSGKRVVSAKTSSSPSAWLDVSPPARMARGVEGGADLVVAEARAEMFQPFEMARQVLERLLRLVSEENPKPGDAMPSERKMMDRFGVGRPAIREAMQSHGFNILPGTHPIVPIMLGDAALATRFADAMLTAGVYVVGFSYPVVPQGKARIRTQISAAHTRADLEFAVDAFCRVRKELGLSPA